MALVDMKRDESDIDSGPAAMPDGMYPYGLNICLDKDELDKLGITKLPKVGANFDIVAEAIVTRISQNQELGAADGDMSISLQITAMEVKYESPEEEVSESMKAGVPDSRSLLDTF